MQQWRLRTLSTGIAILAVVAATSAAPQPQSRAHGRGRGATAAKKSAPHRKLPCGDLVGFQVLLSRQGFSPGEIDGQTGPNFGHTLAAFQHAKNLPATSTPDCDTWNALGGDTAAATTVVYTITDDDVKGPFTKTIPREIPGQAALPALGYRSPLEELAERFHESPALLSRMNRGVAIESGSEITVPAVDPFDPDAKPVPAASESLLTIEVSRDESALRALREDGSIAFFAPVTTGSIHDPLPIGDWQVTSIEWHPVFHYNPRLFWDAKETDSRATVKPGPNNPVGVVWIGINKEHYGLHGTAEPGHVGHTESHGCVRLTNWDAAHVASLVAKGSPVVFK